MSMVTGVVDDESPVYADKCLQSLITSMDDPFAHWDENLLAAVVILRLHEELSHGKYEQKDPRTFTHILQRMI